MNSTYEDNYSTTNLEAIASGTPVIAYATGGSPESVQLYDLSVSKKNLGQLVKTIENVGKIELEKNRY